jgi:hypothetical protein
MNELLALRPQLSGIFSGGVHTTSRHLTRSLIFLIGEQRQVCVFYLSNLVKVPGTLDFAARPAYSGPHTACLHKRCRLNYLVTL